MQTDTETRTATVERKTKETDVFVSLDLDGNGEYDIDTGIGFLDHMLEQLSRHSLIDLKVRAQGDLHIDFHHTTEDTGIVIGEAVRRALGDFKGIRRYATAIIPMDETCTRVSIDVSQRPNHHIVESCFKGLARALRDAIEIDPRVSGRIPSTKGVLGH